MNSPELSKKAFKILNFKILPTFPSKYLHVARFSLSSLTKTVGGNTMHKDADVRTPLSSKIGIIEICKNKAKQSHSYHSTFLGLHSYFSIKKVCFYSYTVGLFLFLSELITVNFLVLISNM